MLVVPLIVDRQMNPLQAIEASFNALKKDWLIAFVFLIVVAILASLGAIACGIGIIFTLPLFFLSIAVVYRDVFDTPQGFPPPPPEYRI